MDVRKIILIYEMTPIKVSFLHIGRIESFFGRIESFFVKSIDTFRGWVLYLQCINSTEYKMKKITSVLVALAMLLTMLTAMPVSAETSAWGDESVATAFGTAQAIRGRNTAGKVT